MIHYDLKGKAALVTGAASGVGLAAATMLGQAGAAVAINFLPGDSRGAEAAQKLRSEGVDVIEAPGDVGERIAAEGMVARTIKALGRLDLLVNNAGTPATRKAIPASALDLISDELWDTIFKTNLQGSFYCARAAAAALKASRGSIVNTASLSGMDGAGSSLPYSAAKAGVINLTMGLARALAPEVRVNAVAPGAVDGSAWMVEWTEAEMKDKAQRVLLRKLCRPEHIAEVIVFLGVGASMMTGQTVVVDAGAALS